MLREVFLIGSISTTMLYAMGGPVPNYDEKFNENINERIKENIATSTSENIFEVEEVVEVEKVKKVEPLSSDISNIRLKSLTFQEINSKNIPVEKVKSGTDVVYINVVKNDSSEIKRDIIIKNPIPRGTEYVRGSATCNNGCIISYSTHSGAELSTQESSAVSYIEYHFKSMDAGEEYKMGFRATVR